MLKNRDEIAKRWFKLLRDPKSKQAFGVLQRPDGSKCCLGWLCHAAGLEPIEENGFYVYEGSFSWLPTSVRQVMGMTKFGALKPEYTWKTHQSLSLFNDEKKLSLSEIADIAEEAYLNDGFVEFIKYDYKSDRTVDHCNDDLPF